MTEAEWFSDVSFQELARALSGRAALGARKYRLFLVGVCRGLLWTPLADSPWGRRAVERAELMADSGRVHVESLDDEMATNGWMGEIDRRLSAATGEERERLLGAVLAAIVARNACVPEVPILLRPGVQSEADWHGSDPWLWWLSLHVPSTACAAFAGAEEHADPLRERARQVRLKRAEDWCCSLFRGLIGNPFRPAPAVDPAWLDWQGGIVARLARAAYEKRCLPLGALDPARIAVLADALEDAGCTDAELLGDLRGPGMHVRGSWALDLVLGKV